MVKKILFSIILLSVLLVRLPVKAAPRREITTAFEADLEALRLALRIPGMSAAVVQDQSLLWAAGFGYADLENRVAATPDTPYGLASVTKPMAATLIMQLVAEGAIDLDAPITQYGVAIPGQAGVTIRHLLTHTSEGVPGTTHQYNGSRYGLLGGVMEEATGKSFAALLNERVIEPLGMKNTALNPINQWGGTTLASWGDFKQSLSLNQGFSQYPEVYRRLARPYQFDTEYNTIPGMYHLYHNPGAGVISSVTDLARFDIALDQGTLLSEAAQTEMFAPAFSTYQNRPDLMYGLGWYVQEFEGRRLLWHCGRWLPSTSALFLKVPEENLTFIILANTDNLTVPFNSIGWGDVTKSALALAFFRHFIYPLDHGTLPPTVDWEAEGTVLIEGLTTVKDEAARTFLERELWSHRQVYASVGRHDRADLLHRVSLRVFPLSTFRKDPLFTDTTGQVPVVDPIPSAASFLQLSRGIALWLAAAVVAAIWLTVRLIRRGNITPGGVVMWGLAALLLGPLAVVLQTLAETQERSSSRKPWQVALGSATRCMTGFALGWAVAMSILIRSGGNPHPLLILSVSYLVPLLVGFLCSWAPTLVDRKLSGGHQVIAGRFLAEIITFNLAFAVLFPLTVILSERVFSVLPPPGSPYFWAMLSTISTVEVAALFLLHYWMIRRGHHVEIEGDSPRRWPSLRNAWGYLVVTLGVMIASLAVAISQMG